MTHIIVQLINGTSWQAAITVEGLALKKPKIKKLAKQSWKGRQRAQIKSTGYVVDTLEAALWAVDSTVSFRDAILLAVNLGDDADTVGAVAGQLAGARYGYEAVPANWTTTVAWSDRIVTLARDLHKAGPA